MIIILTVKSFMKPKSSVYVRFNRELFSKKSFDLNVYI